MRWITAILLTLASYMLQAQDTLQFPYVDKETYKQYIDGNWKDLKLLAKKAIKQNIDYFYLRMRTGIAYYQTKNYVKAIKHFKNALVFNSADETALEYLYYSYLNLNKHKDAMLLVSKMNDEIKNRLDISDDYPFIDKLTIESSYNFNENFAEQSKNDPELIPAIKKTVINNYYNTYILLNHPMKRKTDFTFAITNLTLNSIEQRVNLPPYPWYSYPPEFDYVMEYKRVFQNQYYGKLNFHLFNRGDLAFGFHFLSINTKTITNDTYRRQPQQSGTRAKNAVFFTSFNKDFLNFNISVFASISNLDFIAQNQQSVSLAYYPFGNLNLYAKSGINVINEKPDITRFVYDNRLGLKIAKKTWFESTYSFGDIKNYLENEAFLVYNNTNTIKSKLDFSIIFIPKSNIQLNLRYYYINNFGDNIYTTVDDAVNMDLSNINNKYYKLHSITGGITWKF